MLHVSLRHDDVLGHQRLVPDAVLAAIQQGSLRGELDPHTDTSAAAEVLTAVYFDTLSCCLVEPDSPFDLQAALQHKLDLVLAGLNVR